MTGIDKTLFPTEYAAIERLKDNSKRIEGMIDRRRKQKLKRIKKCRRKYEEHSE